MKKMIPALLACCLALIFGAAAAEGPEERGEMVSCEYAVSGGMENESFRMTLSRGEEWGQSVLTVRRTNWEGETEQEVVLSRYALKDLEEYVERLEPERWQDYPLTEYFALDAPSTHVSVTYENGQFYTLSDSREGTGKILRNVYLYMNSYLAEERETFSLSFSSFDGGGPEYRPVIADPEMLDWGSRREYDEPYDPMATGSGYTVTLEFRGRIPGKTEMYIEMDGPLVPVAVDGEPPRTVYVLEIDGEYNVKLLETKEVAGGGV